MTRKDKPNKSLKERALDRTGGGILPAGAVELCERDLDGAWGGFDPEDRYRVKVKFPWLDDKIGEVTAPTGSAALKTRKD